MLGSTGLRARRRRFLGLWFSVTLDADVAALAIELDPCLDEPVRRLLDSLRSERAGDECADSDPQRPGSLM